jgi:hypothetical protein
MWFATKLAVGSLVALALTLGSQPALADEGDLWSVVIKKVEVKMTDEKGDAWDINGGKPDLVVMVRNLSEKDSKPFRTEEKADTFVAEFNVPTTIRVRADQVLEFEVIDQDAAFHDLIGKHQHKMTADDLKAGNLKLEKDFGQVICLELELEKL